MADTLYAVTFTKTYDPRGAGTPYQVGDSAAFNASTVVKLVAENYAAFNSSDDATTFADQVAAARPVRLVAINNYLVDTGDGSDPAIIAKRQA